MTKETHQMPGAKPEMNGAERRRRRAQQPHRGMGRRRTRAALLTHDVPLPEDAELRLFLSTHMAATASELLLDLVVRLGRGDALDLKKELLDAALPALLHQAMDSDAESITLSDRDYRWFEQEIYQVIADVREASGSGCGTDGNAPASRAGGQEEGAP
jgi:hypothetical protein